MREEEEENEEEEEEDPTMVAFSKEESQVLSQYTELSLGMRIKKLIYKQIINFFYDDFRFKQCFSE